MVTSGHVSTVRVPSTYTSGLELPTTLSLPRSSMFGQRLYCDQLETCSWGIARRIASRIVRPGSADSACPLIITAPPVVDVGLPPGSVDRSKGRDVVQFRRRIERANGGRTERVRCTPQSTMASGITYFIGSTGLWVTHTSQCRCGPVGSPVEPTSAIFSPRFTL